MKELAYLGTISIKDNGKYLTLGRIILFKNNSPTGKNPPKFFGNLVFFKEYLQLKENLLFFVSLWEKDK